MQLFNWENAANAATVVAGLSALFSLPMLAWQGMKGAKVKEAEFLLQLEAMCTQYNDVYWKLLDGGVWTTQGEGPTIEADLLRAEDYMGFFEYCEILIKNGAIRERLLMLMFGYKIMCLARNKVLMAATVESPVYGPYWELFASIAARANKNSLFRSH